MKLNQYEKPLEREREGGKEKKAYRTFNEKQFEGNNDNRRKNGGGYIIDRELNSRSKS